MRSTVLLPIVFLVFVVVTMLGAKPAPRQNSPPDPCGVYEACQGEHLQFRVTVFRTVQGEIVAEWYHVHTQVLSYRGQLTFNADTGTYTETYEQGTAELWCGPWTWTPVRNDPLTFDDRTLGNTTRYTITRQAKAQPTPDF
jgi:hypothetical protein